MYEIEYVAYNIIMQPCQWLLSSGDIAVLVIYLWTKTLSTYANKVSDYLQKWIEIVFLWAKDCI